MEGRNGGTDDIDDDKEDDAGRRGRGREV